MRDSLRYSRPGAEFRRLREERELTLQDADALSLARFGEDGHLNYQQISRIERDALERPGLHDVVRLGALYGLSAQDVAALYGLSPGEGDMSSGAQEPEAIRLLRATLREVPEDIARDTLFLVQFAALQARARARDRTNRGLDITPDDLP